MGKGWKLSRAFLVALLAGLLLGSMNLVALAAEMEMWHDKLSAPSWQKPIEQMSALAESQIGIDWKTVGYANTDMHQTAVKTALPTSRAPELFTWWSTFRMESLVKAGLLADVTDIWNKYGDQYNPALRKAFEFNGKVYGIPVNLAYWSVWYSKPIFDKYNLKPPKTWDEFLKLADFLKSKGVTPIGSTVSGRWPTFIWFEQLVAGLDPGVYEDLMVGKTTYTNPTVKKAFDIWKSMINKGYFTDPGTDVFADFPRMMAGGKAAMILMGDWYTDTLNGAGLKPDLDYDTFILPPINPKAGNMIIYEAAPLLLGKNADRAADAKKIADWWMSAKANETWSSVMGFIPANKNASSSFLMAPKKHLLQEIKDGKYRLVNRFWEATPSEICENAVDEFARFILNTNTENEVLSNLNNLASKYWDAHK